MTDTQSLPQVWGLVPAAGRGERFGGELPKQFIEIGGRPLLAWTLERLLRCRLMGLTVAVPEEWRDREPLTAIDDVRIRYVAGGATRQASVQACLEASPDTTELVLVHDGARPAVATEDVHATILAAATVDGAVLGRSMGDTVKKLDGDRLVATIDRRALFRAETPQVFRREILVRALQHAREDRFVGTDEASLVERLSGAVVRAVRATHPNPKLTGPGDLPLMQALLALGESW